MAPFYGWSSTASWLQPLRGSSLLFTTQFPEIPGTHFIDLGRMKGWLGYRCLNNSKSSLEVMCRLDFCNFPFLPDFVVPITILAFLVSIYLYHLCCKFCHCVLYFLCDSLYWMFSSFWNLLALWQQQPFFQETGTCLSTLFTALLKLESGV